MIDKINLRIENLKKELVEVGDITLNCKQEEQGFTDKKYNFWKNRTKRLSGLLTEIEELEKLKDKIDIFN